MDGSGDMSSELVALLLADHEKVKAMLQGFETVPASQKDEKFCEITHELIRHEVAEEEVVYPALRRYADGGDDLADLRIKEQSEAEKLLDDMEKAGVDSAEFATMFTRLRTDVLAHAEAEQQTVFPELSSSVGDDELRQLGKRYEMAKKVAPTHPHPHAPDSPPGDVLLGPVAALVDRVRDAVRGVKV